MKLTTRFSTLMFTIALMCLAACEMSIPPFLPLILFGISFSTRPRRCCGPFCGFAIVLSSYKLINKKRIFIATKSYARNSSCKGTTFFSIHKIFFTKNNIFRYFMPLSVKNRIFTQIILCI